MMGAKTWQITFMMTYLICFVLNPLRFLPVSGDAR